MSDPRFARLRSDPRFRQPRKHKSKGVVDERFSSLFAEAKKNRKHVDKYGRPIPKSRDVDNSTRVSRHEGDDEATKKPDYARGDVLLESSDEGSDNEPSSDEDTGYVTIGKNYKHDDGVREINLDESDIESLDAQAAAYQQLHPEQSEPDAQQTRRLAIVNLDWDHVKAVHLYKICSSLVSPSVPLASSSKRGSAPVVKGNVVSVRVYPSTFGKERMALEEMEGPPAEIFKNNDANEEVNEQNIYEVGEVDEHNGDALRKYQLERLRYYFAVVTCDTADTANHIYTELEGTELERSANVFDLSFVPEDMEFDDEFRDEATGNPNSNFKAVEFVTDALRHSKVKLTWDEDDPERIQLTKKRFSAKEIENADFAAYLGSSSSESEAEAPQSRKGKAREKMRSLLLGNNDELPEGWDRDGDADDVDMEVTFTAGLSKPAVEETSLETYQRKKKDIRQKKKELRKDKNGPAPAEEDEFFEAPDGHDTSTKRPVASSEELAAVINNSAGDEPKHFDMKSVIKAEKLTSSKGRKDKRKRPVAAYETQEDFVADIQDKRFSALFEDPTLAIDPTHPQFKKTKTMSAFLEEGSNRRSKNVPSATSKPSTDTQDLVERIKKRGDAGSGKRRKFV